MPVVAGHRGYGGKGPTRPSDALALAGECHTPHTLTDKKTVLSQYEATFT